MEEYTIKNKDRTTDLKLQVLPQLMKLDKIANMIGEFNNNSIYLQTKKIVGNINCCMGFVKDKKSKIYVPNTALKMDIRDITIYRGKIVAILKKDATEQLYNNLTYLNKNYKLERIIKESEIINTINLTLKQ